MKMPSNYLGKTLRLRPGDALRLFNDSGHEYAAEISEFSRRAVRVQIQERFSPAVESPLTISLGLSVSKGDHGYRGPEGL